MRVLNKTHWPPSLQIKVIDNAPTYPNGWPKASIDERDTWCKNRLPKGSWFAYSDNWGGMKIFAFTQEDDLLAFKLRWS